MKVLEQLSQEESFNRIVFLGSTETINEIEAELSKELSDKVIGEKPADLKAPTDELIGEAYEIFFQEERQEERNLWMRIRDEYFSDNPAVVGPNDVLMALLNGRVDTMILTRDVKIKGTLCRDCENVSAGERESCAYCKKKDIIEIDLVNELVRQAQLTGAEVDFVDPVKGLTKVGNVAALLRY